MLRAAISRASASSSAARSGFDRFSSEPMVESTMSRPISSCTGPSWIASATRRRTSASLRIVRRDSSRARMREADSSVCRRPTTSPVDSAASTNTVSWKATLSGSRSAWLRSEEVSTSTTAQVSGEQQPATLALEVGVGRDQEHGGRLDGQRCLGGGQLHEPPGPPGRRG